MDILNARFGYKLQIGGHDMFMTEYDLQQLARLLQERGFTPKEEPRAELEETTEPVNAQMLRGMNRGDKKLVRVPLEKVRTMYTQVHAFNQSYGRHITCKIRKRYDGNDAESKSYVLERFL